MNSVVNKYGSRTSPPYPNTIFDNTEVNTHAWSDKSENYEIIAMRSLSRENWSFCLQTNLVKRMVSGGRTPRQTGARDCHYPAGFIEQSGPLRTRWYETIQDIGVLLMHTCMDLFNKIAWKSMNHAMKIALVTSRSPRTYSFVSDLLCF